MNKDLEQVDIFYKNKKIGTIGYDAINEKSYFLYDDTYLQSKANLFPLVLKRTEQVQVFTYTKNSSFRGLPSVIADSLPDDFGNEIFQNWLKGHNLITEQLTPVHQLAYLGNRAMGALEFKPSKIVNDIHTEIHIEEIADVLQQVIHNKAHILAKELDDLSLLNIFKLGTSAGGARPKIIISEHKTTGTIYPGDIFISNDYHHWLVKLGLDKNLPYSKEMIEFVYYKLATQVGITMTECKMIANKHFATKRFDRVNNQKIHMLTASGMSGIDFKNREHSSYNNLFKLTEVINISKEDVTQLFRRMVFNYVFSNTDDHLKNVSFQYNDTTNDWSLAPAYDITFSRDPLLMFENQLHALFLNGKKKNITIDDFLQIAKEHNIKKASKIIQEVVNGIPLWLELANTYKIPKNIANIIQNEFNDFGLLNKQ